MLRTRRRDTNVKPNRRDPRLSRLDRKSSRGMIYENEELRLKTININAEIERGQYDIKKLRRENDMLKKEIWCLRDEYEKLDKLLRDKQLQLSSSSSTSTTSSLSNSDNDSDDCSESSSESTSQQLRMMETNQNLMNQERTNHNQLLLHDYFHELSVVEEEEGPTKQTVAAVSNHNERRKEDEASNDVILRADQSYPVSQNGGSVTVSNAEFWRPNNKNNSNNSRQLILMEKCSTDEIPPRLAVDFRPIPTPTTTNEVPAEEVMMIKDDDIRIGFERLQARTTVEDQVVEEGEVGEEHSSTSVGNFAPPTHDSSDDNDKDPKKRKLSLLTPTAVAVKKKSTSKKSKRDKQQHKKSTVENVAPPHPLVANSSTTTPEIQQPNNMAAIEPKSGEEHKSSRKSGRQKKTENEGPPQLAPKTLMVVGGAVLPPLGEERSPSVCTEASTNFIGNDAHFYYSQSGGGGAYDYSDRDSLSDSFDNDKYRTRNSAQAQTNNGGAKVPWCACWGNGCI